MLLGDIMGVDGCRRGRGGNGARDGDKDGRKEGGMEGTIGAVKGGTIGAVKGGAIVSAIRPIGSLD